MIIVIITTTINIKIMITACYYSSLCSASSIFQVEYYSFFNVACCNTHVHLNWCQTYMKCVSNSSIIARWVLVYIN